MQPGKQKKKLRFKNRLVSLDATVIALCASVFDRTQFRRTKGWVKLDLLLDHEGLLPSFAVVTEGKQHEVRVDRQLHFAAGDDSSHRPRLLRLRVVRQSDPAEVYS